MQKPYDLPHIGTNSIDPYTTAVRPPFVNIPRSPAYAAPSPTNLRVAP